MYRSYRRLESVARRLINIPMFTKLKADADRTGPRVEMPEALEMKWVYMLLVIGVLYGVKSKPESTRNLDMEGPSRGPN